MGVNKMVSSLILLMAIAFLVLAVAFSRQIDKKNKEITDLQGQLTECLIKGGA